MPPCLTPFPKIPPTLEEIHLEHEKFSPTPGLPESYFSYIDRKTFLAYTKKDYDEFIDMVARVDAIFVKAYDFYFTNLAKNLPDFISLLPYFRSYFPLEEYFVGRYDILIDPSGEYKFLETNANTPGMITESFVPSKLLTPTGYTNQANVFVEYVKSFWKKIFQKHQGKIGILLPYSFEHEDFLVGIDYRSIILQVLPEDSVIIGDIFESNILPDGTFTLKGEAVSSVLSFFPFEFFLTDPEFTFSFFESVKSGKCTIYNPLESMVLQDKLIFAVIWENFEKYSKEEQTTIKRHIPFSTRVFQEESERFLAKWRFGRYGREIYTEDFYTNIDQSERFIFQEKITPRTEDEKGSFIVLGAYTNYSTPISVLVRKQEVSTTDDTYNEVTLVYVEEK